MFKTRQLLEDRWRDADGLTTFLQSYGQDVRKPMVYQWFLRERVPSEWGFLLLALLELETGAPISLARYAA